MYQVYVNNFKRNNSIVTNEELMFQVPNASGFPVQRPVVKANEDSAENYSFTMELNSPYYDSLLEFKTLIRVVYDGDVIFYGKVLNIATSSVYNTKNVTCAGYYAFFNDSYYEGKQEKYRSKMTVDQYYTNIISNHNSMIPNRPITRGVTGVTLPSEQEKYEPTSWSQTSNLLNGLTSSYGGHMKVRVEGTTPYLDWYKYYTRDLGDGLRPEVKVGKNILDLSSEMNSNNIFTRVIPTGDTDKNGKTIYIEGYNSYNSKVMPVPYIRNLYTDVQLTDEFHDWKDYRDAEDNYGIIYKPMSFPNADTQAKLWDEVKKWIKESYFGIASSFTVKAIDLHIQNGNYPKILLGDCVNVTYLITRNGEPSWVTKKLVCKSVSYDLFNPENNSYTFGVPSDLLDRNRVNKKSSKSTVSGTVGGGRPGGGKEDETITWHKVWQMIGSLQGDPQYEGTTAAMSFYNNGEITGSVRCYDPSELPDSYPMRHLDLWFDARNIGKITLSGYPVRFVAISEERGIFAYEGRQDGPRVVHWYTRTKGLKYQNPESGISSFDRIVKLIEQDTDPSWGGASAATSFKNNGKISGSVSKCYDPNLCTASEAQADSKLVFSAEIAGKFTIGGQTKYVAISNEYGIFAFNASARGYIPATHWYMRARGITYDNASGFIVEDENGNVYTTGDGSPDGDKTVLIKTKELTGQGSQGEILVGYDLTGTGDNWKVKLNVPIQYVNKDGQTVISDGFVSASDFNLDDIPSFKTKLAVVDVLVAGKVNAADIEADLAYIRNIRGDHITADTAVWASNGNFTNVTAGTIESDVINYKVTGMSPINILSKIYATYRFLEDNGTMKLQATVMNNQAGGYVDLANFNIAATQFYIDAVAAAHNTGGKTAYCTATRTGSMSPGQSSTITVYYTDPDDVVRRPETPIVGGRYIDLTISASSDSNLIAENIKKNVTIFGVTGSYEGSGGSAGPIDIPSNQIYTTSSLPSGTKLNILRNKYEEARADGDYVAFRIDCPGATSKWYYMEP